MQFVGIFYVINNEIFCRTVDFEKAIKYGDLLTYEGGHDDFWQQELQSKGDFKDYEFDYFPRGRVVYNYVENLFIIFIDSCIDQDSINARLIINFGLHNKAAVIFNNEDEHYCCHKCNNHYIK